MNIKVRGKVTKYEDVEIDQEEVIYAIERCILEKVSSLKDIDHITKDGKKMVVADVDYHTGNNSYTEVGEASEVELKATQLINDIKKLLHSKSI